MSQLSTNLLHCRLLVTATGQAASSQINQGLSFHFSTIWGVQQGA